MGSSFVNNNYNLYNGQNSTRKRFLLASILYCVLSKGLDELSNMRRDVLRKFQVVISHEIITNQYIELGIAGCTIHPQHACYQPGLVTA